MTILKSVLSIEVDETSNTSAEGFSTEEQQILWYAGTNFHESSSVFIQANY